MDAVAIATLSWTEYQQRIQAPQTVVFIPCGALEQHGPHLPLGTDALLSTAVASSVAEKLAGIVAPAFSYGYKYRQNLYNLSNNLEIVESKKS